jgi:glutaconate CoA-transferase subunit B
VSEPTTVAFLVRGAREFLRGGWVFTGFHWPVLAGQLAARLDPDAFAQLFEAGATTHGPAERLPTSTTDFAAFGGALAWRGTTTAVFPALVRRADRVVLDAANVDLTGAVNATAVGPYGRPRVRLAGGGGAADAAAAARELVLLHGGQDPRRIVAAVEHVTAAPAPAARVRLLTRWATLELHPAPRVAEVDPAAPGTAQALAHLRALGVADHQARAVAPPSAQEAAAARELLAEAARRGYLVATK